MSATHVRERSRPPEAGSAGVSVATLSILYFIGVIAVAHLNTVPTYSWTAHSISKLAAQATPNAWLMRLGFVGFGSGLLAHLVRFGSNGGERDPILYLVGLYAASVVVSGLFSAAPIDVPAPRPWEASVHRAAATLAGIGFSVAILLSGLRARSGLGRFAHFTTLFLVIVLSALFEFGEPGNSVFSPGVAQRVLYLIGLTWLLVAQTNWRMVEAPSDFSRGPS